MVKPILQLVLQELDLGWCGRILGWCGRILLEKVHPFPTNPCRFCMQVLCDQNRCSDTSQGGQMINDVCKSVRHQFSWILANHISWVPTYVLLSCLPRSSLATIHSLWYWLPYVPVTQCSVLLRWMAHIRVQSQWHLVLGNPFINQPLTP